MKQLIVLTFLSILTLTANSQDAAKLLEAEMHLKKNEFEKAKNVYEELFTEFDNFRKKNTRKAIMGYTKAVTWWVLNTEEDSINKTEELLKPYPYLINYAQYPAAKIKPEEEAKVYKQYSQALYNVAHKQFSKGYENAAYYAPALELCNAAISLDNLNFNYYHLRGLININLKKYSDVISDWKQAIVLYELSLDSIKADYYFSDTYYGLAYLLSGKIEESNNVKNIDSAIYYIQKLRDIVEKTLPIITDDDKISYMKLNVKDADKLELDIYVDNPTYLSSTVSRFKDEVDKDPDNYKLNVAYAGLLAIHDTAEAIVQYKRAIQLDSTQTIAYYNLAALYMNISYRMQSELFDHTPTEVINEANAIADANCNLAYPLLVKAHTLSPDDRFILISLIGLTKWLDMDAEKKLYEAKLDRLIEQIDE